jgi:methionyl-tRNA synthetase
MSKSKVNVINADDLVSLFGVDAVRYYLLREMPFAQDGSLTYELLIERINAELVNILGNLVNRTIAMTHQYFDGIVPAPEAPEALDFELTGMATETAEQIEEKMKDLRVSDSLQIIFNLLRRSNKYIDETTPWVLAKDESKRERLGTVLYNLLESIRIAGVLIRAFLPETGDKILDMLQTDATSYESLKTFGQLAAGTKLKKAEILFYRIDANKKLKEIEQTISAPQAQKQEQKSEETQEQEPSEISIEEFGKVKLKTGEIVHAEKHPNADKLYVLTVKMGEETRQIVSGIAKYFSLEELVGKRVVVVSNLKPAKLRGVMSEGMLLMAETGDKLSFIATENDIGTGAEIR